MKLMIVIPTYNESGNIQRLVQEILDLNKGFYITIVDDNSPDGTGQIADGLVERYKELHVIHRPEKAGLGTAYIEGFKYALASKADLIFEMDADFSHDPKSLPAFLEAIEQCDLVIGSRYIGGIRVDGWRFRRLLLSKFANMYVSYIMVKPVWDFTGGFRCYRRRVLESINLDKIDSDGYAFQIEMTYHTFKNGFKVKEIPILFRERDHGYSKISRNVVWEAFWITLKLRAPIMEIIKHLKYLFKDYSEFANNQE